MHFSEFCSKKCNGISICTAQMKKIVFFFAHSVYETRVITATHNVSKSNAVAFIMSMECMGSLTIVFTGAVIFQ